MANFQGGNHVFFPTHAGMHAGGQQQHLFMQHHQLGHPQLPPHHHYQQQQQMTQHLPTYHQMHHHHSGLTFMQHHQSSSPMSTSSASFSAPMPAGLGVPTAYHPFDRQNVTLQAGHPITEHRQHQHHPSLRQMTASPGNVLEPTTRGYSPESDQEREDQQEEQQEAADNPAGVVNEDEEENLDAVGEAARPAPGASAADRETFGIVDEETTNLWDLADGPDGYTGKPPYPYLTLIRIALLCSEHKRLTLQELYDALEARYPFFNGEQKGWKNSIRHNLSLNKCFKKEARHVLDPGKGSYWYVDTSEEYSTPRVRHRRKKDRHSDSLSPPPPRGKKRKQSPGHADEEFGSPQRDAKAARPADLKLPAPGLAPPSINTRGGNRFRAISAPSPSTASFFFGDTFSSTSSSSGLQPFQQNLFPVHPFQGGYVYGAPSSHPLQQSYTFPGPPLPAASGMSTMGQPVQHLVDFQPWRPVLGGTTAVDYRPDTASEDVKPNLHPYRPLEVDLTGDDDELQQLDPVRSSPGEVVVKEEPLELSIPAMVPDTGTTMPDTGSTLCQPATPRSIFGGMLEKNMANTAGGGSGEAVKSPPPGPVASYAFPPSGPAVFPPGHRIMVPPPGMVAGGSRPAPLNFMHRDVRRAYSPPMSAGMAQSPTRLLPSKDYDTLFSNAPFGMIFSDAPQKRASRSGSIFGLAR